MPGDRLTTTRTGAGGRVVLVHGFTQTARSWDPVAGRLAADHEVVGVDAPGHGGSATISADLDRAGGLVVDAGGPAAYVGYSLGARICL
ncbi:MAG: alpha/beta fold hydrolase, partial [Acidimicrobiia bacterium]|nr:alpha/beta fold hydrolase [Acidimicrobiia bacterium]